MTQAAAHCRAGRGPALVHAHTIRPYAHSLSDDEQAYKTAAERAAEKKRDPFDRYPQWLIDEGLADESTLSRRSSTDRY